MPHREWQPGDAGVPHRRLHRSLAASSRPHLLQVTWRTQSCVQGRDSSRPFFDPRQQRNVGTNADTAPTSACATSDLPGPKIDSCATFRRALGYHHHELFEGLMKQLFLIAAFAAMAALYPDRKSTRLNSNHLGISYAVFCLKKKKK